MSETLFRFLLSELHVARVRCACGAIVEVPLSKLDQVLLNGHCRFCNTRLLAFGAGTTTDPLLRLGDALQSAAQITGLEIEFVVPPPVSGLSPLNPGP